MPKIYTLDEHPELTKAFEAIERVTWGQLGFLDFSSAYEADYPGLLHHHADHQLCMVDHQGRLVATAHTLPIPYVTPEQLPDTGWDWVVSQARATPSGLAPADLMLGAVAISVPHVHRGHGVARLMIDAVYNLAQKKGYRTLVVPARPSAKHLHPAAPMEQYIRWSTPKGDLYDPWLRSHVLSGGQIVGVCPRSMVVDEPVSFWEYWAKFPIQVSGPYHLPGCLVPVEVDLESGRGLYVEPGVWIAYDLGGRE